MSKPPDTQVMPGKSWVLPILILLVLSVALNAVFVVYYLKMHRWDRERVVLREEMARGTGIQWKLRDGTTTDELPTLWEMVAGACPVELNVRAGAEGEASKLQEVAAIFARYGTLEELDIFARDTPTVEVWMKHMGPQPGLRSFESFSTSFTDEASTFLTGCPAIEAMTIQSAKFTGEKLPPLPALQVADFGFCSITPAGLRRIMACPSIREVRVNSFGEPSPELLQTYRDLKKAHPGIALYGLE